MDTKYTIVDGELRHYGVKGMKWGTRKRVANSYKNAKRLAYKEMYSEHHGTNENKTKKLNKKAYDYMHSDAFRKLVAKDSSDDYDKEVVKYGKDIVEEALGDKNSYMHYSHDVVIENIYARADHNAYFKLGYKNKDAF